jgi:heat-inducible transcriptional repressor
MNAVTERRAGILRLVVREYVDTAIPVGSKTIRDKYELPTSAATIRSEMQALESAGLLTHPHTSAGRVPSDQGYRFYVESLMGPAELAPDVQATIRHQFYQAAPELDEWGKLAAVLLARSLGLVAIVTPPRSHDLRVRHVELVSLKDVLALLVVVLHEARVLKQLVTLQAPADQAQLSVAGTRLTEQLAGKTLSEIRTREPLDGLEGGIERSISQLLLDESNRELGAHVEGLSGVLEQPEFQEHSDAFVNVISLIDAGSIDRLMPPETLSDGSVSVVIGAEHPTQEMQRCSVVMTPYSASSGISGFIGVLGPTRLEYGRAVAGVRYLSSLLDELMLDVYG